MADGELIAIRLTEAEWGQVMGHLSQGIWHIVNPLIIKIHAQLPPPKGAAAPPDGRAAGAAAHEADRVEPA